MMNRKLLVLDIDGTLTNSDKKITPRTRQALMDIQDAGHVIILASGRPTPGMRRYEQELQLEKYGGYLLSYNGARILDCRTKEVIYQATLPSDTIRSLYLFARENHCGIITYEGSTVLSGNGADEYIALEARINGLPVKEIENFPDYVRFAVHKCLMTAPPEKACLHMEVLQKQFAGSLSIYRSEPFFIEIMPYGIDKASSLAKILPLIGFLREDTICCGDGYNDISMLSYGGIGVAMENARDEVKAAADYITSSNDEDGLVEVIRRFIL